MVFLRTPWGTAKPFLLRTVLTMPYFDMQAIFNNMLTALYENDWDKSDEVWLFGACLLGCFYMYTVLSLFKLGNKSWYLTLYSSSVTTVFSVYFIYRCTRTSTLPRDPPHESLDEGSS